MGLKPPTRYRAMTQVTRSSFPRSGEEKVALRAHLKPWKYEAPWVPKVKIFAKGYQAVIEVDICYIYTFHIL